MLKCKRHNKLRMGNLWFPNARKHTANWYNVSSAPWRHGDETWISTRPSSHWPHRKGWEWQSLGWLPRPWSRAWDPRAASWCWSSHHEPWPPPWARRCGSSSAWSPRCTEMAGHAQPEHESSSLWSCFRPGKQRWRSGKCHREGMIPNGHSLKSTWWISIPQQKETVKSLWQRIVICLNIRHHNFTSEFK